MSEEKFSIMNEVHKMLDKLTDEHPGCNVIMFAVEFDKDGFPYTRSCKVSANPAASLAAFDMLERYIQEQRELVYKKIDVAGELSEKIDELIGKMGFSSIDDPRFLDFINDTESELGQKLKEMVKKIKKTFGR